MPGYVPSPYVVRDPAAARGDVAPGSLNSARLGYTVNFQVYTPAGYAELADLPVMYVTDVTSWSTRVIPGATGAHCRTISCSTIGRWSNGNHTRR